jgi:ferritin
MNLAMAEKRPRLRDFLQWFVSEQVEEEASPKNCSASSTIARHQLAWLYMLDKEMAQRVYVPPTTDDIGFVRRCV